MKASSRSIISLFFFCGPSHIASLIMAVVVDAVQGMGGRWSSSKMLQKLFEGAKTKFDAAAAISKIGFITYVLTTGLGVFIGSVLRRCCAVLRISVPKGSILELFRPQAGARLMMASEQVGIQRQNKLPTPAETQPEPLPIWGLGVKRNHLKISECAASEFVYS